MLSAVPGILVMAHLAWELSLHLAAEGLQCRTLGGTGRTLWRSGIPQRTLSSPYQEPAKLYARRHQQRSLDAVRCFKSEDIEKGLHNSRQHHWRIDLYICIHKYADVSSMMLWIQQFATSNSCQH